MIDNMLAWKDHIEALCNRTKQRIYFLGRLGSFGVKADYFIVCGNECTAIATPFGLGVCLLCSNKAVQSIKNVLKDCSSALEKLYDSAYYYNNLLRLANNSF